VFSNNKKEKWSNHRKRLRDALESNVHDNQIENLITNFKLMRSNEFDSCKGSLLSLSLKYGSKECALFLIEQGAICNPWFIPMECKYDKVIIISNLLKELVNKYPNNFTQSCGSRSFKQINNELIIDKKCLIERILDPSKIIDNPNRVEYVMENTDFFETKLIKEVIDEKFKSKPEKWGALISLLREIKLKELGI
jgi:hypothetical protein